MHKVMMRFRIDLDLSNFFVPGSVPTYLPTYLPTDLQTNKMQNILTFTVKMSMVWMRAVVD